MQMFRAKCKACRHVFDVMAIPAPVDVFANAAKNCACPLCHNRRGNTCADPRPLTPAEIAHKAATSNKPAEVS